MLTYLDLRQDGVNHVMRFAVWTGQLARRAEMITRKYSFHWKGVSGPVSGISGPNAKIHLGAEIRVVLN
jgi:hypothetical protein